MSPEEFIAHWSPGGGGYEMSERAGAQPHFMQLCQLLGTDAPNDAENYTFEKGTLKLGSKRGFADVFKRGVFAMEYKAPNGDLVGALRQLKDYANALDNPPLLIVSDRLRFEIHTQFTGRPTEVHSLALKDLALPESRELLRRALEAPKSFEPKRTNRDITEEAAKAFADVAERMRKERNIEPDRVAHFLTQCLFCFFAEDVGLLPERLFEKLVAKQITPEKLRSALVDLFTRMRDGGLFGTEDIPWFNGGLFKTIDVPEITPADVVALKTASMLNWSAIDVAIFGTLFERGLDPKKRSQLGAHYTDPETIMRIVGPVVERPLRAEWASAREEIAAHLAKSKKYADAPFKKGAERFNLFLERLKNYRVLDPACGSGNFLYLALKTLKDIEHSAQIDAQTLGLNRPVDLVVSPANVLGIEINEYAAELARVTVWIGELQWRLQHGYPFKRNPVLEPLDHIEHRDALLLLPPPGGHGGGEGVGFTPELEKQSGGETLSRRSATPSPPGGGNPSAASLMVEASWPKADAVIGNPPFVGGSKKRRELGDDYFEALARVYKGRVPAGADLVCYWFNKAWQQIKRSELAFAGFVSTQSIRSGSNRAVLDAIVKDGVIFDAWSDEPWVNDGAAVRVSMVCFCASTNAFGSVALNGAVSTSVYADLTASTGAIALDLTTCHPLEENATTCFQGPEKNGPFEIDGDTARHWLRSPNVNGVSNATVIKPRFNGRDLLGRNPDGWVVDFGVEMPESEAAQFEAPFEYALQYVKPVRSDNKDRNRRTYWWRFGRTGGDLRAQLKGLGSYIVTVETAKHRIFTPLASVVVPDKKLIVVSRSDDTTFGLLQSRIHEAWALASGSVHGDGTEGGRPRYTPTTCFETFPFPEGLTPRDTAHQQTETLDDGAVIPLCFPPPGGESAPKGRERVSPALKNSALASRQAPSPHPSAPGGGSQVSGHTPAQLREHAIAIARAAKRLNDLRERWLNPPEWTERVPEVIPLGMEKSPYPDRILPKANLSERDLAELKKRTLTNLYNQRPAWLADAHAALDMAVAAAYGWGDYTSEMSDNEILSRLLKLNQARS
jgi:hypothetical protein